MNKLNINGSVPLGHATDHFRSLRYSILPFFSPLGAGPSPPLYRISHNTDMDPETANQAIKLSPKNGANADIVDSMSKVSLDDGHPETLDKRTMGQPTRRLVIYPRPQILRLSKSPLVKPPVNMPALKDWFGYGFHLIY